MRRLTLVSCSLVMLLLLASAAAFAQQAGTSTGGGLSVTTTGSGVQAQAKPPAVTTTAAPAAPAAAPPAATTTAAPAASATPAVPAASSLPAAEAPPAAGAASATPAAAAPTAPAEPETVDAGTYSVRLRDLEQRVNELKEQIFRSKARLSLLAETVLQGVVAGSHARIVHENKMGNSYKLVKVLYALDGAPILNKADEEGGIGEGEPFDVYNGSIVPGEHTLTVQLEYRGHGYGIFSYLKGYRFKVNSSHTFTAPEGKAASLRIVGYEKGGPTAPLEERPAVRYIERVDDLGSSTPAPAAAPAPAPAAPPPTAAPAAAPAAGASVSVGGS
jgi:hypothetical protein